MLKDLLKRIKKRFEDHMSKPLSKQDRMDLIKSLVKMEPFSELEALTVSHLIGENTERLHERGHTGGLIDLVQSKPLSYQEAAQIIHAVQSNTNGLYVQCYSEQSLENRQEFFRKNLRHPQN